jgi:hypothetical protein
MFGPTCLTLLAYSSLFPSAWGYASYGDHRMVPSVTLDDVVEYGWQNGLLVYDQDDP